MRIALLFLNQEDSDILRKVSGDVGLNLRIKEQKQTQNQLKI